MARAGASKSLDKPAPKTRGAQEAKVAAPAKAAVKAVRKKAEPIAVAPKPAAKAVKPVAKPVKAVKAAKPAAKPAKAVKASPAKAVNVKAKAAPAVKSVPTRKNSEVRQVAEAKGKRAVTATKAPAKAAPVATIDKVEGGFPAKTLDKLHRLLEEERETYVRQARDLAAEAEALASEREPGDTQFDEESGEGDTLNVERERDLALSASATQAVEEIDRALRRMDTGNYGICERCGKKIAVARLEALPFAALCIDCKSREERRR
ncbi:MAG TPA: TraR/DksA C4-type zinc finger protein [Acidimicrobiia bacterium]|nr:TraR/DksA C4-type zinc finger protein [Acidimicrobiia bacterium]